MHRMLLVAHRRASSRNFYVRSASTAVCVRYAPSPTGALHLGGLRTALFNYALARKLGGRFILRIEDTDTTRYVPGSVWGLIHALEWCGCAPDNKLADAHVDAADVDLEAAQRAHRAGRRTWEGLWPERARDQPIDAAYGAGLASVLDRVYIQSQRRLLYQHEARRLVSGGHAYPCFCTEERLAAARAAAQKAGMPSLYDRTCARLSRAEVEARMARLEPHVIRLRVPAGTSVLHDAVLGEVRVSHAVVDDQVLLKSDGWPTYHLASVVDDHYMGITHVIRGQEWLSSTPKHAILYAALGWTPPVFAHLPLLLNADRSKLSKRHGDASVQDFRVRSWHAGGCSNTGACSVWECVQAAGYLPEALVNFVALLGWTPPDGQELLSMQDIIDKVRTAGSAFTPQRLARRVVHACVQFSLEAINKANAVVDRARLNHINGMHLRRLMHRDAPEASRARVRAQVWPLLQSALQELGMQELELETHRARLDAAMQLQQDRVHLASEFVPLLLPFFVHGPAYTKYMRRRAVDPVVVAKVTGAKLTAETSSAAVHAAVAALCQRVAPALEAVAAGWEPLSADAFRAGGAGAAVDTVAAARSVKSSTLFMPLRFILTGLHVGASMADTMALLGRDECLERVRAWRGWAESAA